MHSNISVVTADRNMLAHLCMPAPPSAAIGAFLKQCGALRVLHCSMHAVHTSARLHPTPPNLHPQPPTLSESHTHLA